METNEQKIQRLTLEKLEREDKAHKLAERNRIQVFYLVGGFLVLFVLAGIGTALFG